MKHHKKRTDVLKRIVSGLLAALMIFGTFFDTGMTFVHAKGSDDGNRDAVHTVTLSQAMHGSLSFPDTKKEEREVKDKESVTVQAFPNDGYYVEYIAMIDEMGEVQDLNVTNNSVTFEATESVRITACFKQKESEGANPPFELSVDETKDVSKTESVEDYILKHADKSKIGGDGKLVAYDMMWVAHTFVDGELLPNATLDTLWGVDKDKDGYSDNADAFLSQADDEILLYAMSEKADYFVGKVGDKVSHAKVTDWLAVRNDVSGTVYDDIVYDDENRLVYVPSKYRKTDKEGKIHINQTKIQLLYTVTDTAKVTSSVNVAIDNDGVDGDVIESGVASGGILNPVTEFVLANDDEAAKNMSEQMIDAVVINGIEYPKDSNMWEYDKKTKKLVIGMSSVTIDTIDIKMSDGVIKNIKQFIGNITSAITIKTKAANRVPGSWTFSQKPQVGDLMTVNCTFAYGENPIGPPYESMTHINPYIPKNLSTISVEVLAKQICGLDGTGVYTGELENYGGSYKDWKVGFAAGGGGTLTSNTTVTFSDAFIVDLVCTHVGVSLNFDAVGDKNTYNYTGTQLATNGSHQTRFRLVNIDEVNHILTFAIITPTSQTQAGIGYFEVPYTFPEDGKIQVQKFSEEPEYTTGNPFYSMIGVQYGVYPTRADANAGTNKITTLTVQGEDGLTEESKDLSVSGNNYFVKEISLGSSKGYKKNSQVKEVTVTANAVALCTMDGRFAEPIEADPETYAIKKVVDEEPPKDGKATLTGDLDDLSGIKFRFSYYPGEYTKESQVKNLTPALSAVFQTNKDGDLNFMPLFYAPGQKWDYKDDKGNLAIPLGTCLVTEESTLERLKITKGPKMFQVKMVDGHPECVPVGSNWDDVNTAAEAGAINNWSVKGRIVVYKADKNRHNLTPEGDAELNGIEFTITNRSKHKIKFGGKDIPVGSVVTKIYTSTKDGISSASLDDLPQGTYQIVETAGTKMYQLSSPPWSATFSIKDDGQEVPFTTRDSWDENLPTTSHLEIMKVDENTQKSVPQGDATLEGTEYTIVNRSARSMFYNGQEFAVGAVVTTVQAKYDAARDAYIARVNDLPYGTYDIEETGISVGYKKKPFKKERVVFHEPGQVVEFKNGNPVQRGGISVTKADQDWNTSNPQGDASLVGVTYEITNRSEHSVTLPDSNVEIQPGQVVMTITTKWDEATQTHVATTGPNVLPYGTYDIKEIEVSEGYLNANWSETGIEIRADGEMHAFDEPEDRPNVSGLMYHDHWNVNPVQRGGIIVGKVDRETNQYISLGEAHLDGAVFKITNRSKHPVYVNGKTYAVGDVVMNITTKKMEYKGETIYAATTGDRVLPYGTYEIQEISSGTGYLYDKQSREYTKTVSIRKDGEMKELIDPEKGETVANQVLREDWNFKKKAEDSMERMDSIAFLVESLTTGERHVIVTDENGMWGSGWTPHTTKTNANDPTSPISNGALAVENGEWVVKDPSKLDCDAGTWFTGMKEDLTVWAADGKSYDVNGKNVTVKNDKRAFPYDTYRVQELRCPNNEGYGLVSFTVTLHRYTSNHDGEGLDIDYGTIDDRKIDISTMLANTKTFGKVAPADSEVELFDTVTFGNLIIGKKYMMKGEIHLVNQDGKDEGIVATEEKEFRLDKSSGRMTMNFTVQTKGMDKKKLVAFEYLMENGKVIAKHEDLEDENQTILIPKIRTTLTGDLGHMSYAKQDITLTDTIHYENFEVGKEFTATGTLMQKVTDEEGNVKAEKVLDADGKPITATTTFVALKESGTVDVVFKFSNVDVAGKRVTAFETVEHAGIEYAVHADIDDDDQTVGFPLVDTFAVDNTDNNKELANEAGQQVKDIVKVTNLLNDYEYKLVGELHVRGADNLDEGPLLNADEKPYVRELTWKGTTKNQMMLFDDVDASQIGGKDIVVFQHLYGKREEDEDWVLLGEHADIMDEDQSLSIPLIHTTLLTDQEIHESQVPADGIVKMKDTVTYKNVIPGHEYFAFGTLHIQEKQEDGAIKDGGEVTNDRKPVVSSIVKIVPEKEEGTAEVVFSFDASDLDGKSTVAFESLYSNPNFEIPKEWEEDLKNKEKEVDIENLTDDLKVARHEEITDLGQTVHFVDLHTTFTGTTGTHEMQVPNGKDTKITLTDVIAFHGLIPGRKYTANGVLHKQVVDKDGNIKDGGKVVVDGKPVTGTTTFVAAAADGEVNVDFTFDAKDLDGETIVAFESMSTDGKQFAVHADITDAAQTVQFVKIHTTATAENGLHQMQVPTGKKKTVKIKDVVSYENVVPGIEHVMSGTLHIQSRDAKGKVGDSGVLKDADHKPITSSVKFTPKERNGSVEITFEIDASKLGGKTVVAFEDLMIDGKIVASHADITDEEQAVHFVKIRTKALAENKKHEIILSYDEKTTKVTDLVEYKNLIPGLKYTMTGEFHIQGKTKSGKLVDKGTLANKHKKAITSSVTFTPKTADGNVTVKFEIPTKGLNKQTLVAYETLTYKGTVIATHADITDQNQAVFIKIKEKPKAKPKKPEEPTVIPPPPVIVQTVREIVKTGQTPFYLIFATLGIMLMAGGGYFIFRRRF